MDDQAERARSRPNGAKIDEEERSREYPKSSCTLEREMGRQTNGEMEKRYGREGVRLHRKKEEESNIGHLSSKARYLSLASLLTRV